MYGDDGLQIRIDQRGKHPPIIVNQGVQGSPAANGTIGFRFGPVPENQRWFLQYLAVDSTPTERPNVTARIYMEDDRANAQGRIYGTLHGNRTYFGPLIVEPGQVLGVYYSGGLVTTDKMSCWIWGYAYNADDPIPFPRAMGGGIVAPTVLVPPNPPVFNGARVYLGAAPQSIPNNVASPIIFDNSVVDTAGYWDGASKFIIPPGGDGTFLVIGQWRADVNASGERQAEIDLNGGVGAASGIAGYQAAGSSANTLPQCCTVAQAVAGDFFQLSAYQNSGGPLNALTGNWATWMSIIKLGL